MDEDFLLVGRDRVGRRQSATVWQAGGMKRQLVMGDLHGCYDALRTLCDAVGLTPADTLITLGDYVNKGPDSRRVIDWLLELDSWLTLVPLRGNHDLLMHNARHDQAAYHRWQRAGGEATLRSYAGSTGRVGTLADVPASHWQFLDNRLLPSFATDTHFFVHAGVDPALPLEDQPPAMLYECTFSDPKPHCSGKIMVCGHTAQKSGVPLVTGHAICLDTWCSGRGWLSCLDLGSGLVHQANQGGATRVVRLPAPG